jgi:hypothetical protein
MTSQTMPPPHLPPLRSQQTRLSLLCVTVLRHQGAIEAASEAGKAGGGAGERSTKRQDSRMSGVKQTFIN